MPKKTENIQTRKNVNFSEAQIRLIQLAVDLGMALSESEYIRRAVDEMNKQIPLYQKLKKLQENNVKLKDLDERLSELDI